MPPCILKKIDKGKTASIFQIGSLVLFYSGPELLAFHTGETGLIHAPACILKKNQKDVELLDIVGNPVEQEIFEEKLQKLLQRHAP